jgi:hypothetical protein
MFSDMQGIVVQILLLEYYHTCMPLDADSAYSAHFFEGVSIS